MATQAHLAQEAFDYAFETSLWKPWPGAELQLRDPIILPANKLYSLLQQAEDAASVVGQQTGIVTTDKPWVRKRRRESSPLEELTQRDEKRFRADESRAADQTTRDDSSYKTGSTSEGEAS